MLPLRVLLISDGRPGHYHLAEGVIAAIARSRAVEVTRREITRSTYMPTRLLATLLATRAGADLVLRLGYGISAGDLPPTDLIVSAGGDTIAANAAAAARLGAQNIYCGTLRHLPVERFSLVVTSYQRFASRPRHIVALKPNGMDPDRLAEIRATARAARASSETGRVPEARELHGLLVGGNSGFFRFEPDEWRSLEGFLQKSCEEDGLGWIVSTSRRTPDEVADRLGALARQPSSPIHQFIDFRVAGPGTLPGLLARVAAVLCTEDSSTMMSEAVTARIPVIGVAPRRHDFKSEEREYRETMLVNRWCASVPLAELTPGRYRCALASVTPLVENHLDRLARMLVERLPQIATVTA